MGKCLKMAQNPTNLSTLRHSKWKPSCFFHFVVSSIPFVYLEPNNIASNQFILYFVVFLCFSSHWSGLPTFKMFYAKYKFKTINYVRYIIHHESQQLEMFKCMENTHPTIQKWKLIKKFQKYQQQKKLDWILKKFNGFYSFSVIMVYSKINFERTDSLKMVLDLVMFSK